MGEKVDFLGMTFDNVTMDEAVARVEQFIQEGTPHKLFCPNVALYIWSRSNGELRHTYETSDLLTADGMGIYYASRLLGNPVKEMISAVFLFFRLVERAAEKGYRLYLLGTKLHILEKAIGNLQRQYPALQIVGWHNGYFTPDEELQIVGQIADARPDILFIGMSTPLKERFVERNLDKMGVPVCIGVGGSFDVAAGVYKLAPAWMRKAGLEWLYRLIQEPRRMWRRYLTTNTVFVYLVFKAFVTHRLLARLRPARGISKEQGAHSETGGSERGGPRV
jgi:N-acetylglucosaminyldiphosphoundecaprenol N-acetyl-beta-D-mannosaminyltransferase